MVVLSILLVFVWREIKSPQNFVVIFESSSKPRDLSTKPASVSSEDEVEIIHNIFVLICYSTF